MTNSGGWGTSRAKQVAACHPERTHYAKGMCRLCYRNTPFMRDVRRRYYQANREAWKEHTRRSKERRTNQVRLYGVSKDELDRMLKDQRGLCALCGDPPKRKALALDHCHRTGKVRAFLCHRCNGALGLLKDDPILCGRAANYLRRYSVQPEVVSA
jgi:hypothetical protein